MTRLVEAISKAIAAVKFAPLRNSDRANATAAYEHDEDAAPSPAAIARVRGAVVAEQPHDRRPPHHRLYHRGEGEPEDQRPQDFPGHRPGQA